MRKILFFSIVLSCLATSLAAQVNFNRNWSFFQSRQAEYQAWMASNGLGRFFKIESMQPRPQKLILRLTPAFTGISACDSLRSAWHALREQYFRDTRQPFHALLLEKFCFQMDLPLDSAEISIHCPASGYTVRIFGERNNGNLTARFEEHDDTTLGNELLSIAVGPMKSVYYGGGTRLGEMPGDNPGVDLARVRRAISDFFDQYYQPKNAQWRLIAYVDTSSSSYNEFTYHITQIKGAALKDPHLLEYHRIHIKVEQVSTVIVISWDFSAKYGSGLAYLPHTNSNDYHDLEVSAYKARFEAYQRDLFKKLEVLLKGLGSKN